MKRFIKNHSQGYLLPAVIFLGLAISTASSVFLMYTSMSSETLNQQNYDAIAEEAARSGIEYADSCLTQSIAWEGRELRPNTTCTGTTRPAGQGSLYVTQHATEWRSTFRVTQNTTDKLVISTGILEILDASGRVVDTVQKELRMNLGDGYETIPTSTGRSITAIKADSTACAIANGGLYCWGANVNGQLGIGVGAFGALSRDTPQRVGGALAGKTVTKVSVSNSSVCAVADGEPFCWGGNSVHQLGHGNILSINDVNAPQNNTPKTSSGPLRGHYVTDIGTASSNNPAGLIWPFATAAQHSCALRADGAVACWGYGGFRQLTGGYCGIRLLPYPSIGCFFPSHINPTLVKGYSDNTGPFRGKKAVRVGASSHDSCLVANGIMYCWGVEAPLMPEGFGNPMTYGNLILQFFDNVEGIAKLSCTLPLGMFSDPAISLWLFNPCVMTYSNGYDAINAPISEATGTLLDPVTWDVSSNEGCWMAHRNFYCFGTTPAFAPFWLSALRSPWVTLGNTDVTDADNGDSNEFIAGGLTGLYCIVEKGRGRCTGQIGNPNTGRGYPALLYGFHDISTATGLDGQVATKIAAGTYFGCVVANGRLYCWGDGLQGKRASGDASFSWTPVHTGMGTGTGVSRTIGTGVGQYAAHDSVAAGESHSCGIANGKVFCWGSNASGQLGMGDYNDISQPRAVPQFISKAATKVSAGKNHTCAIVEAQLWCWGSNLNGQLGIPSLIGGTTATPRLVNGNGALTTSMRVSDVSTSDNNTCAVANAKVYCWGANGNRQVGDSINTSTVRNAPTAVNGNSNILGNKAATAVSVGTTHACAVVNADLYCWGNNANGRTGLGTTLGNAVPSLVSSGSADLPRGPNGMRPAVSGVAAGLDFTCAIFNGMVSCWGNNANGRTGRSTIVGNTMAPAALTGTAGAYYATTITAGSDHACALLHGNNSQANGNMYCWGGNSSGQLGYGNLVDRLSAEVPITGGSHMTEGGELRSGTAMSAGKSTTCAIANAVILCWGSGPSSYQLGTGIASSTLPVKTDGYQVTRSGYAKGPVY